MVPTAVLLSPLLGDLLPGEERLREATYVGVVDGVEQTPGRVDRAGHVDVRALGADRAEAIDVPVAQGQRHVFNIGEREDRVQSRRRDDPIEPGGLVARRPCDPTWRRQAAASAAPERRCHWPSRREKVLRLRQPEHPSSLRLAVDGHGAPAARQPPPGDMGEQANRRDIVIIIGAVACAAVAV